MREKVEGGGREEVKSVREVVFYDFREILRRDICQIEVVIEHEIPCNLECTVI